MGIATLHDRAFADGGVAVKSLREANDTKLDEHERNMIEARDRALRDDPRVREAIREGKEALSAQPARSTIYPSGEAFLRDFV